MHKRKFVDKATDEGQKKKMRDAEKEQIFASCSFTSLGLHPTLCEQLKERLSFEVPTLIQSQAIPVALSGRHVLVNAATGTGKTIAYLAPIIHHLQSYEPRIQRSDGTFALILVPTHELCMQIYEILQKLVHRFHWIVPGYIMGGENRLKEKARLRKGISVLVATPGRLLDHLMNTTSFQHSKLRWLIFDEADRILELGFGKEIEDILDILGTRKNESNNKDSVASCGSTLQRQNLLLSATLNDKVNHLAKISLENPVMVGLDNMALQNPTHTKFTSSGTESEEEEELSQKVISSNEGYTFPAQLVQRYAKVPCGSRLTILLVILKNLFEKEVSQKAVVFFSTCNAVDFHYSLLSEFCWSSNSQPELEQKNLFLKCKIFRLHGDMMHEDRRKAFQAFKTEKSALLLSTDVSARGLDIPKVRCILQYDSPGEATEYVHRVGRTARLGEKGESLLFLQPLETDYLQDLEKHGVSLTEYPILKLLNSSPMLGHKPNVKKFISIDMHPLVVSLQMALESFTANKPDIKELAIAAFCSWVRAYTAHRGELKKIFMVKKLHLGHVARSFGLKEQPSFVGALKKRNDLIKEQRYQRQIEREIEKKKKRDQKQIGTLKKRKSFIKS